MMPLLALALTFGGITCWMIHRTVSTAADRILVGSTSTLRHAVGADGELRKELLAVAVSLLHSRAALRPIYSIHYGDRLLAGSPDLAPPDDYNPLDGAATPRHEPAHFARSGRDPLLPGDFAEDGSPSGVFQPAYLRDGVLEGRPVRIATEIRLFSHRGARPMVIQAAEFLDDREAYEQIYYLRVGGAGVLIVMIALLLFYGAITWGLGPFASLTAQIDEARKHTRPNVRVVLAEGDPYEARLLASTFNDLMARTERATQSLRQFTSNASHQLRTPLAIVRLHTDVLARYGATSLQGATALDDIVGAIDSLDRLLSQLIALARLDEPSHALPEAAPFDLCALAAAAVAHRVSHPDTARMDVGFEASDMAVEALGNEMLASEMISNLLDNAVRYNRPDGSVTVRVLWRDGVPAVEVDDDGPGIAPENREKVWERFYRVPGADAPPGSGLGLPIVWALGERIGARTMLEDGPQGRGLRAVLLFQKVPQTEGNFGAAAPDDSLLTGWMPQVGPVAAT